MVMKKTRRKHLLRTIRKNGISFFAVAVIAAISIAIFLGFQSTADAILTQANRYFVSHRLEHLEVSCGNGITPEDIEAIAGWDGVDAVGGGYTSMVNMEREDETVTLQARSLCEGINEPVVLEGTLPVQKDEAAIEEKLASEKGLQVGDVFTVEHDGSLVSDTFRVTAIINEPVFSCANIYDSRGKSTAGLGGASYYMELSAEAFDTSYYADCFSVAYVRNASLDEVYYFSADYKEQEAAFKAQAEELGKERAELRYNSLTEEAQSAISEAREEIADHEQKLADAEREIEDGREQLSAGLEEIQTQLTALGLPTDLDEAEKQLGDYGIAALPLKNGIAQYRSEAVRLEEAEAELEEARGELEDAKAELADAEEEAEDIRLKDWVVADRNEIGDVRGVETIVEGIFGLSYSMSAVFFLVAIIICYATITRMINEQRSLIGAQKALGFRPGEILKHYMLYNTLCALLGIVIGYVVSVAVVELLVLHIYAPEFILGTISLSFSWKQALIVAGICLAVFLTATYAACAKLVRLPATTLLRGEVPVHGKKYFFDRWKCYKRLNLYSRTMIKNVLNDKGRMVTTVMGVVGGLSLLVICISLKLAIADSSVWQFDQYFLYDYRLVFDSSLGSAEAFVQALDEQNIAYTQIQDKLEHFRVDGGSWENGRIVAVDDAEALKEFMVLENIDTGEIEEVPQDGLLVSRRAAEAFGLSEGSTVEFMDAEGKARAFNISGVIEHYLGYHMFVTTESYFVEAMGEPADACVFLLKGNIDGLDEKVRGLDGFISLKDNSEFAANSEVIDPVIGVCLLLAVVMSLLVLLNQVVIHINRKARELAVMRINGYTLAETRAYIYKDNIVLTLLGLLLGCAFGVVLAYAVVRAVETGALHYVRTPNIYACLYGSGVVGVFALIVNLIALRKIKQLNLTNVSGN